MTLKKWLYFEWFAKELQYDLFSFLGLDYWLDNLMCQVPEVLMCYHLDGIVQKVCYFTFLYKFSLHRKVGKSIMEARINELLN
jgi:hypothetical protein